MRGQDTEQVGKRKYGGVMIIQRGKKKKKRSTDH